MKYLVITILFLGDRYHGRTENGREPEWPPSPLRLYQAVLAGAAPRWHDLSLRDREFPAFEWFQSLPPPRVVAPAAQAGRPLLTYVRENLSDVDPEKRDAKFHRPTLFCGEPKVTYYWPIDPKQEELAKVIASCARHCRALGWGIDMVIGDGGVVESEPEYSTREKWLPMPNDVGGVPLRVARDRSQLREGTVSQLMSRFSGSLERLAESGRNPVPPLNEFRTIGYRRSTDPPRRAIAAFSLLKLDGSAFRTFDTARRALTVAGMIRHATKLAAERAGWPDSKVNAFILGHGESKEHGEPVAVGPRRFAYLPLPSIEARGGSAARVVGSIRRVMLTTCAGNCEEEIAWARRALSGQELIDGDEKQAVALLSLLPASDRMVQQYLHPAASWASVTPVVLPGYDDPAHYRRRLEKGTGAEEQKQLLGRLSDRIDSLLRKAIMQAGFSQVLADHAGLEWRKVGFWPGVDLADRYGVPDHLRRFPRLHVRINWRDARDRPLEVRGPVCIGGGRFCGLGLFAALAG